MTMPASFKPINKSQKEPSNPSQMPSSFKPISLVKKQELSPEEESEEKMTDEEFERNIDRAQARIWSRVGETVLGAPGDIASFLTGLFGEEQKVLPKSSDIREVTKKAFSGKLEPTTEFEKTTDEFVSDIASMSLPGSGPFKAIRNIGIPLVGTLIKEGLKYNNSDEKTQAYGKVGTMVALDLISRRTGGAQKYATSLFKKAEEALPKGVSFDASNLQTSLDKLEKTLSAGGSRPTSKRALEKVLEIKGEIKNGKIDAKRLAAYRPSINEAIDELGGFTMEMSKKQKPAAIRNLNQVKGEVIKNLEEYGNRYNPEYAKFSRDANEAWAAYQKSNKISNFIQKKIGYNPKSKAVQALFSLAPTASVAGLTVLSPQAFVGGAASMGVYQTYKVMDRVVRSPVLRKFYVNALKGAASGNIPQTSKNLKALDKHMIENE